MPVFNNALAGAAGQSGGAGDYTIERSLRFDLAASSKLTRTPSSAGNRKTWTMSYWIKRTGLNVEHMVFSAAENSSNRVHFYFPSSDQIAVYSHAFYYTTNHLARDPSAWMHLVFVCDTTQATATNRFKIYKNGVLIDSFQNQLHPAQNLDTTVNGAYLHQFSGRGYNTNNHFDGYLADVYFIDGQALAPTDFGEFDADTGAWNPLRFSGNYGTNGFHLDFSDNSSNAALGTDSSGNSNTWAVHNLTASGLGNTSGVTTQVPQDVTGDWTGILGVTPTNTNGAFATIPDGAGSTQPDKGKFYWSGLTVGDTITLYGTGSGQNRSITGDVDEASSPGYVAVPGASLGSFTVTVTAASGSCKVDHNGAFTCYGITPGPLASRYFDDLLDSPTNYEADSGNNGGNYCTLNPLDRQSTNGTLSNGNLDLTQSSAAWAMYRGTMAVSSGKWYYEINIGANQFSAFGILSVEYQMASATNNWPSQTGAGKTYALYPYDGKKYDGTQGLSYATANTSPAGDIYGVAFDLDNGTITFYKNGSTLGQAFTGISGTFAPAAWLYNQSNADSYNFGQRPFAYTPPTGYVSLCTTNLPDPLIADGSNHFDTKLYTGNGGSSTITVSGLEFSPDLVWLKGRSDADRHGLYDTVRGATKRLQSSEPDDEDTQNGVTAFNSDGFDIGNYAETNGNNRTYVAWAWDAGSSNTTISAGSLNSSVYDQSQTWSSQVAGTENSTYPFSNVFNADGQATHAYPANGTEAIFTPNPSFSNATTVKIWYYAPTLHANAFKLNGTGVGNSLSTTSGTATHTFDVTGTGFTSLSWSKGVYGSEDTGLLRIDVDGKQLVDSNVTAPNVPSIASTVRANPTAGFSIVSWQSRGTNNDSVAHGLNKKPDLWIMKSRSAAKDWYVYTDAIDGSIDYIVLNDSDSKNNSSSTVPTSNVFHVYGSVVNSSNEDLIGYFFNSVEGYSAFGSYVGNGNADGPFVYTGMRPRWLLLKESSSAGELWVVYDSERNTSNVMGKQLYPSLNAAEADASASTHARVDFLSNGFKIRGSHSSINTNSETIIWAAFAENPFKIARAR